MQRKKGLPSKLTNCKANFKWMLQAWFFAQLIANAYIWLPLYEVKWVLFERVLCYVKVLPSHCQPDISWWLSRAFKLGTVYSFISRDMRNKRIKTFDFPNLLKWNRSFLELLDLTSGNSDALWDKTSYNSSLESS